MTVIPGSTWLASQCTQTALKLVGSFQQLIIWPAGLKVSGLALSYTYTVLNNAHYYIFFTMQALMRGIAENAETAIKELRLANQVGSCHFM